MFEYSSKKAANAYSSMNIESGVLAADSHKLIMMLFDGAIVAISNASLQMSAGMISEKGKSISHAISIVDAGLRASLNKKVGGELAQNLDALYGYIVKQLLLANLNNESDKLTECKNLLSELRSAWEVIGPKKDSKEGGDEPQMNAPRDALAPRKAGFIAV
ncbi:flagellar protein FliS [Oxalobacteraceae bacterium GrIS 2.11]